MRDRLGRYGLQDARRPILEIARGLLQLLLAECDARGHLSREERPQQRDAHLTRRNQWYSVGGNQQQSVVSSGNQAALSGTQRHSSGTQRHSAALSGTQAALSGTR
jgi:hypothetical protein